MYELYAKVAIVTYIGCGHVGNTKDNTSAAILAGRQGNLHLLFGEQETSTLHEQSVN